MGSAGDLPEACPTITPGLQFNSVSPGDPILVASTVVIGRFSTISLYQARIQGAFHAFQKAVKVVQVPSIFCLIKRAQLFSKIIFEGKIFSKVAFFSIVSW